jgi:hypothetical protein
LITNFEEVLRQFLGALDEPFASKVKILGGPSMVGLHADGSDTERDPKTDKMKDRLIILEKIVEQMTDTMCSMVRRLIRWRLR